MIYLTEHYGVSRGIMSALVVVVGIGAIAGVILGGRISNWMLNRGWIEARVLVPGAAMLLATLFLGPAIWVTTRRLAWCCSPWEQRLRRSQSADRCRATGHYSPASVGPS